MTVYEKHRYLDPLKVMIEEENRKERKERKDKKKRAREEIEKLFKKQRETTT